MTLKSDLKNIYNQFNEDDKHTEYNELHYFILALEDRRFFSHIGVDFIAIFRELKKTILGKKHGGASTINMQLVRTITNHREKTIYRKIREIILSVILNFKFSKKEILNCYMRVAYLGNGITGYEAAIKKRFSGKPIDQLQDYDLASLAGMLLYPLPKVPNDAWEYKSNMRALYALKNRNLLKNKLGSEIASMQTQSDLNQESSNNLDIKQAELNELLKKIKDSNILSKGQLDKLENNQKLWKAYINSYADFASSYVEGGTMHALIYSNIMEQQYIQKLQELKNFLNNIQEI